MANTASQNLLSLDFATNKASLKTAYRNNPYFRDVDFEASNINLLLDILAYNNYMLSFYTNMNFAEAFLDSAQLRSSIVSHAKDLNYLPASARSPVATIRVTFDATGASAPYTIERGSPFTTLMKSRAYTFTTPEKIVVSSSNSTFTFDTDIYEGTYLSDVYMMSDSTDIQRFRISNQEVDTDSIIVTVFEDGSQYGDTYIYASSLLGLNQESKVFFVQATQDGYYEILFGDSIFGHRPAAQSIINITYRTTAGDAANGAKVFSCDFDPTGAGELNATPTVTLLSTATEGSPRETNESIRSYAPRYFAAQQRAVASDDYKALVLANFSGQVDDINVYGGETQEPKQYGRVIVSIKPKNGTIAPDFLKQDIISMLTPYVSIPTRVITQDPEYFYVKADIVVQYDSTATTKKVSELTGLIKTTIDTFGTDNLEKFGRDFRYSRFVAAIDNTDTSFVSNETSVRMVKRLAPTIQYPTSFVIAWENALDAAADDGCLLSDTFTFLDTTGIYYPYAYLKDDGAGSIDIWAPINDKQTIVKKGIGSVNYSTGLVTITKMTVSSYTDYISLGARLVAKDFIMSQRNILMMDLSDMNITLTEKVS